MITYYKQGWKKRDDKSLRQLRRMVGKSPVTYVNIIPAGLGGILWVAFDNGDSCRAEWASMSVLKDSLRRWRNLRGVPLKVMFCDEGVVGFDNEALKGK